VRGGTSLPNTGPSSFVCKETLAKRYGLRISLDWLELFCVCGMHLRCFLGQAFFDS